MGDVGEIAAPHHNPDERARVPKTRQRPHKKPLHPWADQFRMRRLEMRLRQADIAAIIGVQHGVVCQWEAGYNLQALFKIQRWADVLGFDVVLVPRQGALQGGKTPGGHD